jgi:hypothetical protein
MEISFDSINECKNDEIKRCAARHPACAFILLVFARQHNVQQIG